MKDMFGKDDYRKIPNGAPGIETLMTLIHSEGVAKGKITLKEMVKILSENTAKIFGLKNKGSICPGKDADIVIFNPKIKFNISYKKLHMNVDYNPYEGFEIAGMPEIVYVRGKKAAQFKNDRVEFVGEIGRGRFIKREPSF
jgi:dihydropyrimidinase